jgi:hypothetical protein
MRKMGLPPRTYKKLSGAPAGDGVAGARIEKLAADCEMLKMERRRRPADHLTSCLVPICPLNLPHDNWRRNVMNMASNIPTSRSSRSGRGDEFCTPAMADELTMLRERVSELEVPNPNPNGADRTVCCA